MPPLRFSHERADPCATASTPLRSRSSSRRTRCGSLKPRGQPRDRVTLDKAWEQVRVVFGSMQERATGCTASPDELKDAASTVTAILAKHFPEGPKGAARAHRQFVRWLGGDMAAQTLGAARWAAAFRDIKRLESDPAKPNYLAEVCPCDGVNFSQIGHGPDLRGRALARAKAKVWSALSWSLTPDGGLILSKSGQPGARLTPDRSVSSGQSGAAATETRYLAPTDAWQDPTSFGTVHQAKTFLEHWRWERPGDKEHGREQHAGRSLGRGSDNDCSR
jgi:hypothetical protein